MFAVIDKTNKNSHRYHCNDIDTAADIVLGITDSEDDADTALGVMGYMRHDDMFVNDRFAIFCYDETKRNENKYDSGIIKQNR